MKIGVVGAGIAGLTTAIAFARHGAEVVVFERPDATTAGAGIALWSNGLRALDAIDLGAAVRALGSPPDIPTGLRTPTGRWLIRTSPAAGPEFSIVHRADLHGILSAAAPAVQPSTVVAVESTAADATVTLDSGASRTFDLVIGADGIGSTIRRFFPDDPGVRYAGYTCWRGVTEAKFDVPASGETVGRGERFGIFPLGDGRVYWFASVAAPAGWRVPDERAELRRRFAGWHDPIRALLNATDDHAVLRNDIIALAAPLARFTHGRVALVGDAAHAMTPNLGQGGNQGLEDAVTLATLVDHEPSIDAALARYDELRPARTASVARRSLQMGKIAQAGSPLAVALRNTLARLVPAAITVRSAAQLQDWQPPS